MDESRGLKNSNGESPKRHRSFGDSNWLNSGEPWAESVTLIDESRGLRNQTPGCG